MSAEPRQRKARRTEPAFDARQHLYRVTGVDLTRIDGIDAHTALKVVGEIGLDMTRWPTEKHFASWLCLAPGSKITGGKRISGRTKPSASRAAAALRLAASSLYHSKSALGAYHRRMKARLGAPPRPQHGSQAPFSRSPSLTPPFPADLAKTTTIDGNTVDYIVRVASPGRSTSRSTGSRSSTIPPTRSPARGPRAADSGRGLERQAGVSVRPWLRPPGIGRGATP